MIRIISKDGTGATARILDRNGMDLTKKIAVGRISFDLTAGGFTKANADLYIDGVDAAIPEMAWRTKHPASGEYEPLASMTFRDGTVVSFAKGTGTVSWNKGGGHRVVGEAGAEMVQPERYAGSNEVRRPEYVLRVSKTDYAWMGEGGAITGDLAKARRFTSKDAIQARALWFGYSIETVAEAQARIDADPVAVVIYHARTGNWRTGDISWTADRSKAKRFPPVYGKLVTTDHPTWRCETIVESDARISADAAKMAVISHKNTGAFLFEGNSNSLFTYDLAKAKRFSQEMALFLAAGKEWNVETVEAAHARLKAEADLKAKAAKDAEIVVIYDTVAKAWFSGAFSASNNHRALHLLNAVRYTRKAADDMLRGTDAYRNGIYVIQTLDEACKVSPVYAVGGTTHVGFFKGKIFVPEEIRPDPSPAAPSVSVAKIEEEPKDFLLFNSSLQGWFVGRSGWGGLTDDYVRDPAQASRMTAAEAENIKATSASGFQAHLIVERRDVAIARVEARNGKGAASNANAAPTATAANDDVYPPGGYVDRHGKPVTLADLRASWGSDLRPAKEVGK